MCLCLMKHFNGVYITDSCLVKTAYSWIKMIASCEHICHEAWHSHWHLNILIRCYPIGEVMSQLTFMLEVVTFIKVCNTSLWPLNCLVYPSILQQVSQSRQRNVIYMMGRFICKINLTYDMNRENLLMVDVWIRI